MISIKNYGYFRFTYQIPKMKRPTKVKILRKLIEESYNAIDFPRGCKQRARENRSLWIKEIADSYYGFELIRPLFYNLNCIKNITEINFTSRPFKQRN